MKATSVVLAISFTSAVASANVEIGATAGLHVFSHDNELGTDDAPNEPSLKNAPLFGLRLGILGNTIGLEAEAGLIPTKTRGQPVVDVYAGVARGHLVLQFRAGKPENVFIPFILVGGGVMHVTKTADTAVIFKDVDELGYAGLGVKFRGSGWGFRLDGRVLLVPSSASDGALGTQDFEALASLYIDLGRKKRAPAESAPSVPPPIVDDPDNEVAVTPPPKPQVIDTDKDGVVDPDDKCADQAEDKDSFQDEDGCPDPDNDSDGVADADDKCGDQPETKNGITDEDGCPDDLPADLAALLDRPIKGVTFKPNSAAFAAGATKALDNAAATLAPLTAIKLEVQAHTDDVKPKGKLKTNDALSQARADAVKAYLVKKGVDAARLEAKGYAGTQPLKDPKGLKGAALKAARRTNARVEFKIVP